MVNKDEYIVDQADEKLLQTMFDPRCSRIKEINTIILDEGATTDSLSIKVTRSLTTQ